MLVNALRTRRRQFGFNVDVLYEFVEGLSSVESNSECGWFIVVWNRDYIQSGVGLGGLFFVMIRDSVYIDANTSIFWDWSH